MNNVRYIAINDQVDTLLNENDFAPFAVLYLNGTREIQARKYEAHSILKL